MGLTKANPDIEAGVDYATKEHYIRLYLDIILSPDHHSKFTSLMNAGKAKEAKDFLISVDPEAKDYAELFLGKYETRGL
jgi:hypothetical protein